MLGRPRSTTGCGKGRRGSGQAGPPTLLSGPSGRGYGPRVPGLPPPEGRPRLTAPSPEPSLIRDLTILIPALNEAQRIGSTLERLLAYRTAGVGRIRLLVVDDGSTDGTAELVARRFGETVGVLRRPRRGGKGAALRTGVGAVTTEWLLFVDADLSIPIEELERLLPFTERAPIVIGSKRAPGSDVEYPRVRRFLGGIGQQLIALFVVRGFHDTQCGFKLFRSDVARELFGAQRIDGFGFDFEVLFLARRLGHAVAEVPIRCEHRSGGSVRLGTYVTVLREIGTILVNRVRGVYPRR